VWCIVGILAQSVYRLDYGMDDRSSIPGRDSDGICFLRHRVQTGSGAHPVSNRYRGTLRRR
jgi:hypothetical protein